MMPHSIVIKLLDSAMGKRRGRLRGDSCWFNDTSYMGVSIEGAHVLGFEGNPRAKPPFFFFGGGSLKHIYIYISDL